MHKKKINYFGEKLDIKREGKQYGFSYKYNNKRDYI